MDKSAIVLGAIFAIFAIYYAYTRNWRHPEGFAETGKQGQLSADAKEKQKEAQRTAVVMETANNPPYAMDPIQSVDDYEFSLVFKNEGDNKAMTKQTRDYLMSQYPRDWTVQPPSSELFQQGLAKFKEAFANPAPVPQKNPYRHVDGSTMTPPDTRAAELAEREILATYVPKNPQALTTYDAEDARELVRRIYDAKGLNAEVKQTGANQFTIVNTRRKDEKVVYEDEAPVADQAPATKEAQPSLGEGTIIVPPVAHEVAGGLDPFFQPSTKARDGKFDYTSWTPGLERMFAPTFPQTNWY